MTIFCSSRHKWWVQPLLKCRDFLFPLQVWLNKNSAFKVLSRYFFAMQKRKKMMRWWGNLSGSLSGWPISSGFFLGSHQVFKSNVGSYKNPRQDWKQIGLFICSPCGCSEPCDSKANEEDMVNSELQAQSWCIMFYDSLADLAAQSFGNCHKGSFFRLCWLEARLVRSCSCVSDRELFGDFKVLLKLKKNREAVRLSGKFDKTDTMWKSSKADLWVTNMSYMYVTKPCLMYLMKIKGELLF